MNERIKELMIEAGMIIGDTSEFDMAKFMPKELKFAQLIVRECMCISDSIGEHGYIAAEEMGKHFGVGE